MPPRRLPTTTATSSAEPSTARSQASRTSPGINPAVEATTASAPRPSRPQVSRVSPRVSPSVEAPTSSAVVSSREAGTTDRSQPSAPSQREQRGQRQGRTIANIGLIPAKAPTAGQEDKWFNNPEVGLPAFGAYLRALLEKYNAGGAAPNDPVKMAKAAAILDKMTAPEVVATKWAQAFTHSSIPDIKGNFERREFIGDKVLGDAFSDIMDERFGDEFTEELGTDLNNFYMSADFQSKLTDTMGLMDYLYYDTRVTFDDKMRGDVFETFMGALKKIAGRGAGYQMVENVLITIFASEIIDVSKIKSNPVARLNNIITANNLGRVFYNNGGSDNFSKGDTMSVVRNEKGAQIGKGYGKSFKDAERAAATAAIETLRLAGIETENLNKVAKLGHLVEQDDFEAAVARYNKLASAPGLGAGNLYPIAEWRIEGKKTIPYTDPVTREAKVFYIQTLKVAYHLPSTPASALAATEAAVLVDWRTLIDAEGYTVASARARCFSQGTKFLDATIARL